MTTPARLSASPFNTGGPSLDGRRILITDVTLREGQQAAEVAFSDAEKEEIATRLAEAGVPIVQVGYAGQDEPAVARIRAANPGLDIASLVVGWQDSAEEAISATHDAGASVCSLLFRGNPAHLVDLGFTVASAQERIRRLAQHATGLGFRHVVFGPSFATLSDWDTLSALCQAAVDGGAGVVSVSDSTGVIAPWGLRGLVTRLRETLPGVAVRVHTHNDFGLALANALAAVEAGADWVEASVNGLGERAGNCALEELVVALRALYGYDTGVDTRQLTPLSRLVARTAATPVPPMKPVVGADCFANKLEIHMKTAAVHPELMEPFDPSLVGGERTVRLGRGTGPTGVRVRAERLGVRLTEPEVERLVTWVNQQALATKRAVDDDALSREIARMREGGTSRSAAGRPDAPRQGGERQDFRQRIDEEALRTLFPELDLITDESMRSAVVRIWSRLWQESEYTDLYQVPVSLKVDYPQVKHTQAVAQMALAVAEAAERIHGRRVRRDVLLAGALLMDASKLVEYRPGPDGSHQRSAIGHHLPHATYAAHLALEAGLPLEVVHILMAHSPNGGKSPDSLEAHILDGLDQIDLHSFGFDLWRRTVVHYQP
jgi:isopropylmalate/homocitrate/citramalate synthase